MLKVKLDGGYADEHMIPIKDMVKVLESIQTIVKNEELIPKNEEVFLYKTNSGSYELFLTVKEIFDGLPDDTKTVVLGAAGSGLWDLTKRINSFIKGEEKLSLIKLYDELFEIASKTAEEEYMDIDFDRRIEIIKQYKKKIKTIVSTIRAISQLFSIIDKDSKYKPKTIQFTYSKDDKEEVKSLILDIDSKSIFTKNQIFLDIGEAKLRGYILKASWKNNSFVMSNDYIGELTVYTDEKMMDAIMKYMSTKEEVLISIIPTLNKKDLTIKYATLKDII